MCRQYTGAKEACRGFHSIQYLVQFFEVDQGAVRINKTINYISVQLIHDMSTQINLLEWLECTKLDNIA